MGIVMIDADTYKKLVLAEAENEKLLVELQYADHQLKTASNDLKDLLLFLTDGRQVVEWKDKKLQGFDIVNSGAIAEYLNTNYMQYGVLQFNKIKGEQEDE